jgi:predicted MFS family arabinose efflux permease
MATETVRSTPTPPANPLRLVQLSYWLSTFVEGATRIIIPLYFANRGVHITTIAMMFVVYEAFGLATNMLAGFFLNRFGYRRAFLLALLLHTVSSTGYLWISPDRALLFVLLLVNVLRAMRGIAKELIKTASAAYVKHLRTNDLQCQWLLGGKDSAKGVGILGGGVLLAGLGFTGAFLCLGLATLACLLWAQRRLREVREAQRVSYDGFIRVSPQMRRLAWARATLYAGRDLWLVLAVPVFLTQAGVSEIAISAILAVGLLTFGFTQPAMGWLIKRRLVWRGRPIKAPWLYEDVIPVSSLLLACVPVLMLCAYHAMYPMIALILLFNLLAGLATSPHNDLQIRFARRERAAVDIAYYKTVAQLGKVAAVLFSGLLYDAFGLEGCLIASAASLVLSAALGVRITREARRTPQAQKFIRKYALQRASA